MFRLLEKGVLRVAERCTGSLYAKYTAAPGSSNTALHGSTSAQSILNCLALLHGNAQHNTHLLSLVHCTALGARKMHYCTVQHTACTTAITVLGLLVPVENTF